MVVVTRPGWRLEGYENGGEEPQIDNSADVRSAAEVVKIQQSDEI